MGIEKANKALERRIVALVEEKGLTQRATTKRLGISIHDLWALMRYESDYSLSELMILLTKLGQDVTIVISPSKRKAGKSTVAA